MAGQKPSAGMAKQLKRKTGDNHEVEHKRMVEYERMVAAANEQTGTKRSWMLSIGTLQPLGNKKVTEAPTSLSTPSSLAQVKPQQPAALVLLPPDTSAEGSPAASASANSPNPRPASPLMGTQEPTVPTTDQPQFPVTEARFVHRVSPESNPLQSSNITIGQADRESQQLDQDQIQQLNVNGGYTQNDQGDNTRNHEENAAAAPADTQTSAVRQTEQGTAVKGQTAVAEADESGDHDEVQYLHTQQRSSADIQPQEESLALVSVPTHNQSHGQGQVQATTLTTAPTAATLRPQPSSYLNGAVGNLSRRSRPSGANAGRAPTPDVRLPLFQAKLEAHVVHLGGPEALDQQIEKPRVQLLLSACKDNDAFFAIVHQLYCIWSQNRQRAYARLGEIDGEDVDTALQVVRNLMRPNDGIGKELLNLFITYPICSLRPQLAEYHEAMKQVRLFIRFLASTYRHFPKLAVSRGYPFLVDELLSSFNCTSPYFQSILFTSCLREVLQKKYNLPVEAEAWGGGKFSELFSQDQKAHQDENGVFRDKHPNLKPGDFVTRNCTLMKNYLKLFEQLATEYQSRRNSTQRLVETLPSNLPNHGRQSSNSGVRRANLDQPANPPQATIISPTATHNIGVQAVPVPSNSSILSSSPVVHQGQYTVPGHLARQMHQSTYRGLPSPPLQQAPAQQFPTQLHQQHYGDLQHAQPQQVPNPEQQRNPLAWAAVENTRRVQQLLQAQQQQQQLQPQQQLIWPPIISVTQQNGQPLHRSMSQQLHQRQPLQFRTSVPPVQPVSPAPSVMSIQPTAVPTGHEILVDTSEVRQWNEPQYVFATMQLPVHQQSQGSVSAASENDSLFPPAGVRVHPHQGRQVTIARMGAHQAKAVSPRRVVIRDDGEKLGEHFYQAIASFAIAPHLLPLERTLYEFKFTVTEEQYDRRVKEVAASSEGFPAMMQHFSGALSWRLRACELKESEDVLQEHVWTVTPTSWPISFNPSLNEQHFQPCKKSHNLKDLPVDVTDIVRPGENVLRVAFNTGQPPTGARYAIAVEAIETMTQSAIKAHILREAVIPAETALDRIVTKARQLNLNNKDDGLVILSDDLSIDLSDPWTTKIFSIPARGANCLHFECFDLDNFLHSRYPKPVQPGLECPHTYSTPDLPYIDCKCDKTEGVSKVDDWKCPKCFADARPYSLRIDGFLAQVRGTLEREGKLNAKTLHVSGNGTWKTDGTVGRDDSDAADTEDEESERLAKKRRSLAQRNFRKPSEAEVIVLD